METLKKLTPGTLKSWVWNLASKHLHLDRRLKSGYPIKISSYSDWCFYNDLFVDNEYDEAIDAALDRAQAAAAFRVVDLGANVGYFTIRVLDRMKRRKLEIPRLDFLLVEGSPAIYRELQERLGSIRQPGLNIEIIHGLVGEKSGAGQFQLGHSAGMNQVTSLKTGSSQAVEYVDLEARLSAVEKIDLLKCDIEGSEGAFLRSYPGILGRTEVAIFEFHDPECVASVGAPEVMKAGFARQRLLLDQGCAQTIFFER